MPTIEGCTNLPESESRFRRSVSVSVPPLFTEVATYSVCVRAAGGEPSSPETSTIGADGAVLRHARGGYLNLSCEGKTSFFAVEKGQDLCYNSKLGNCLYAIPCWGGFAPTHRVMSAFQIMVTLYDRALVKAVIER